jgi:RimJ/RimL family protein N-acetyltransferase
LLRPLELLEIQVATLFDLDTRGRIRSPAGAPKAAQLFLGRTTEGNRFHARADLPDALVAELGSIAAREPPLARLAESAPPPAPAAALGDALGSWEREYRGPAFLLLEASDDASRAELVTPANAARLAGPFDWIPAELADISPTVVVVERGEIVSVCHCARRGIRAAEAGAETVPAARGRGHARAAVSAWAAHVRASGRLPLYSTWWENRASLAVAAALGALAYAEDFHLT